MTSDPAAAWPDEGARLPVADPVVVASVSAFLFHEAALVDARRFEEWLDLFAESASYEVPLRVTREGHVASELSDRGRIFADSKQTLGIRVQRLLSEYAWAEQPPSRTRHFVSNVRVAERPGGTLAAAANVLVYRNRGDDPAHDLYSAERRDLLEPVEGSYRILRRWLAVDQSNLTGNSLSVFL